MIESVSEHLASAVEMYRSINRGIGNTSYSSLRLAQSTALSSDLVWKDEQVLSEVALGRSNSTADKQDKTLTGEGGIKVGTSNLWAIAVIDANGKVSLSKTDGTTRTWTDESKNVNSVTQSLSLIFAELRLCRGAMEF